jgi:hypothetical protein
MTRLGNHYEIQYQTPRGWVTYAMSFTEEQIERGDHTNLVNYLPEDYPVRVIKVNRSLHSVLRAPDVDYPEESIPDDDYFVLEEDEEDVVF